MSLINCLLPTKSATVQTLGHPAAGVIGWMGGDENGVYVSPETALTLSAIWCATRIIAETVGTLPCIMYRRKGKDERERVRNDPRYRLVRDAPHPEMNAINFFETQTSQMVLQGNAFARMRRDGRREVSQFEIRSPATVTTETQGDRVVYDVSDPKERVRSEDMLHVAGLGGNGLTGWSVVRYGSQSIGAGMATDKYVSSVYANKATPNGAITTPLRMDKPSREALRKDWEEIHGGAGNAAKIAILHGGMTYQNVSMTPEDVQLIASRNFGVREVARWFRLPPHMLADLENSSVRANIEQQAIEFVVYSLSPWLVRWQQTLNRKLLSENERQQYYFEFLLDALLRGDVGSRYAAYAQGRQWGWLSINDIRRKENMPLVEGGDDYLQPANMDVVGEEPMQQQLPPPTQEPQQDEQIPQSLAHELSANLKESFGCIMDEAKELNNTLLSGYRKSEDAFEKTLNGLRELRNEIRTDMDAEPKVQVRGFDEERAHLIEACNELFRSSLRYVLHYEKMQVLRASKKIARGWNFIGWVDEFYGRHAEKVAEKIKEPAACYRKLNGQDEVDIAKWIADKMAEDHKFDLLDACDGEKDSVAERIESVCKKWDAEVEHATMCVKE